MAAASQRCARTKMVLPLRVWLHEAEGEVLPGQWAHTTDISHIGCRLGGLRTALLPQRTIILQRGKQKAPFRVVWSKYLAENEYQAGIEALDYEKNIWGVELPPSPFAPKTPQIVRTVSQKPIPTSRPRLRWGLALLVLGLALGSSLYLTIFYQSGRVAIRPPLLAPPSVEIAATSSLKPHPSPPSLTKPLNITAPLLNVAEAPTGRIVYPVPPNSGIAGRVRLEIMIAANGLVKQIHSVSGEPMLAQAAAQAVRLWHYRSFQKGDVPFERVTTVTISFLGPDAVSLQFPSPNPNGVQPSN